MAVSVHSDQVDVYLGYFYKRKSCRYFLFWTAQYSIFLRTMKVNFVSSLSPSFFTYFIRLFEEPSHIGAYPTVPPGNTLIDLPPNSSPGNQETVEVYPLLRTRLFVTHGILF